MTTYCTFAISREAVGPAALADGPAIGPESAPRRHLAAFEILLATGLILGATALYMSSHRRPMPPGKADLQTIELWIRNGQHERAYKALGEHLRQAPHDGSARLMLARSLAASGDLAGCTRELKEVPNWWPQKAEALYREGQAFLLLNRAKDAESAFLEVIGTQLIHAPSPAVFHDASQELLSLYASENRWDDARAVLWKLHDRSAPAYRPTALAMRIRSELERIAPSESAKILRRYVDADPTDWEARRALAKAELAVGQQAEALLRMRACLDSQPHDPQVWRDYLAMLQQLGEVNAFDAVVAHLPAIALTEPDLWIFRGENRERAGDWAAAAAYYRRALELKPNLDHVHYRLATIEGRRGHTAQAAAHRARWQTIQRARDELRQAFDEFVDAEERFSPENPERPARIARLAAICHTLGWLRTSEALKRLGGP